MPAVNAIVQTFLRNSVYPATASSDLTTNITRFLNDSAHKGTRQQKWQRLWFNRYANAVFTDPGLIAYWRLNAATGATTQLDLTATGSTLTINGGVTLQQIGAISDGDPAMLFDGATGFLNRNVNDILGGLAAVTLTAWVNHNGGAWGAIYEGVHAYGANLDYLAVKNGTLEGSLKISGVANTVNAGSVSTTGWHHLGITWASGANVITYLDGVQVGISGGTVAGTLDAAQVMLVGSFAGPASLYTGFIDDVATFNRALSANEMLGLFSLRP